MLEALARLSSTSAVYGAGHRRVDEIAEALAATIREAATRGSVSLSVAPGGGADDDGPIGFLAGRFARDLDLLGAARVDIAGDVTGADLVAFATFVRRAAAPRSGVAAFERPDFATLPPAVRVTAREFGTPVEGGAADANAAPASAAAPGLSLPTGAGAPAAAGQGPAATVDAETAALLQQIVTSALREGTALEASDAQLPANVRQVVRGAAEALCRSLRKRNAGAERSVADVLGEAERLLPMVLPQGDASRLLAELSRSLDENLRDAFVDEHRRATPSLPRAEKGPRHPGPPEEELAESIRAFTAGAQAFESVTGPDPAEEISILLHVLGDGASPAASAEVSKRIAAAAARGFEEAERSVVLGWLRAVGARLKPSALDAVVAPVAEGLRGPAPRALPRVLCDACRMGGAADVEVLWPHLVRELIATDDPQDAPVRHAIVGLLAQVPRSRVLEEAPRLGALLGRRSAPFGTAALSPPIRSLFPVYEVLCGLPAETGFLRTLVQSFARQASVYPAAAALGGLDAGDERAHQLLTRMLRERDDSADVRALATAILVARLRALPQERRDAPWVDGAVRALGALPCRESDQFLDEVLTAKRWMLSWVWPEPTRRAAADVLARRGRSVREGAADGAEDTP